MTGKRKLWCSHSGSLVGTGTTYVVCPSNSESSAATVLLPYVLDRFKVECVCVCVCVFVCV